MTTQSNEEIIERIETAMKDKDQLQHVKLKEDKEAVEAAEKLHAQLGDRTMFEKAQQKMAEFVPLSAECTPDENMRRISMQHAYLVGFIAGVEWQKQRTVDILKEPPPLGYGMDWYIEKITGIKQREKPVNGELNGDD